MRNSPVPIGKVSVFSGVNTLNFYKYVDIFYIYVIMVLEGGKYEDFYQEENVGQAHEC